jgi:hypothetical protein
MVKKLKAHRCMRHEYFGCGFLSAYAWQEDRSEDFFSGPLVKKQELVKNQSCLLG